MRFVFFLKFIGYINFMLIDNPEKDIGIYMRIFLLDWPNTRGYEVKFIIIFELVFIC